MLRVRYDSLVFMTRQGHRIVLPREKLSHGLALAALLLMFGLAAFGPSGALAWSEYEVLLDQRQQQIAELTEARDELKNRVAALDPDGADPDMVGELLRKNLNVVHPDEIVLPIEPQE